MAINIFATQTRNKTPRIRNRHLSKERYELTNNWPNWHIKPFIKPIRLCGLFTPHLHLQRTRESRGQELSYSTIRWLRPRKWINGAHATGGTMTNHQSKWQQDKTQSPLTQSSCFARSRGSCRFFPLRGFCLGKSWFSCVAAHAKSRESYKLFRSAG